jgi:hypothetical protein
MKNLHFPLLFILIILFPYCPVLSQDGVAQKDTVELPYRKGPWLTGLSGNLSSLNIESFGQQKGDFKLSNEYDFSVNSGKFIADKLALGLTFSASRDDSKSITHNVSETFSIGPFLRYYLSKNPSGSMYFSVGFLYGQLVESIRYSSPSFELDSEIFGRGPGGLVGIGYTHFLTPNIGLDVIVRYDFIRIKADFLDKTTNTRSSENLDVVRSFFGFGFIIIIPQFVF